MQHLYFAILLNLNIFSRSYRFCIYLFPSLASFFVSIENFAKLFDPKKDYKYPFILKPAMCTRGSKDVQLINSIRENVSFKKNQFG